jgi:hypothetical protein
MEMNLTVIPQKLFLVEAVEVVEQKPVPGAPRHPKNSNTVSLRKYGGSCVAPPVSLVDERRTILLA